MVKAEKWGLGGCLTFALWRAGYRSLGLPMWVKTEDIPDLCQKLGVRYYGEGVHEINLKTRGVVLYRTGPRRGHAEYTKNIYKRTSELAIQGREIVGIIEFPSE